MKKVLLTEVFKIKEANIDWDSFTSDEAEKVGKLGDHSARGKGFEINIGDAKALKSRHSKQYDKLTDMIQDQLKSTDSSDLAGYAANHAHADLTNPRSGSSWNFSESGDGWIMGSFNQGGTIENVFYDPGSQEWIDGEMLDDDQIEYLYGEE